MSDKTLKIKELCKQSKSKDPIYIAKTIMHDPLINIHGPEHHILDGAALLTALHNYGVTFDYDKALDEMETRGLKMPGAICGLWGICGSCASLGAALAIIHETSPLSNNQYYKDNMHYTSLALKRLGDIGGPRCCKRNAFISIETMIEFLQVNYGIELEHHPIVCEFNKLNQQCIKERCPYYPNQNS